jgi:acetate kinase
VEPELKSDTMQSILTFNGGSSSIKFALYQLDEPLERRLYGKVDRIGPSGTNLTFNEPTGNKQDSHSIASSDHKSAANLLIGSKSRIVSNRFGLWDTGWSAA